MFFLFLLFFQNLWAQTDALVGIQARSFPMLGGEVYSEVGHSLKMWGPQILPHRPTPFYGFIRPSLGVNSSVVINQIKGEIDLFPVSFLGITAGYARVYSDFDFPFFDCNKIACRGRMERRYVEGKLGLGYAGFLALMSYKRDHMQHNNDELLMGDFRRIIAGQNGRDQQEELKILLGKKERHKLHGFMHEWIRFRLSGQQAHSTFFLVQRNKSDSNLMLGAGIFASDEVGRGPVIYLRYQFIVLPSLKLF